MAPLGRNGILVMGQIPTKKLHRMYYLLILASQLPLLAGSSSHVVPTLLPPLFLVLTS
jgi:hypothetical protein